MLENGEKMYIPDLDKHVIPGNSKCNEVDDDIELEIIKYKRREYR